MAAKRNKRNWIQSATRRMKKKGTLGSYGHHSMKQINRDIKKGGSIAKKAQFAKNVRKRSRKRSSRR